MNEQFALELHKIGDSIFTLAGDSADHDPEEFALSLNKWDGGACHEIRVHDCDVTIRRRGVGGGCYPINADLGANLARWFREWNGVAEDTETDSE